MHRRVGPWPEERSEFTEPIAAPVDVQDLDVVQEPVEDRRGEDLVVGEDRRPVADVLVRRQHDAAPFVARRDQAEEEIGLR